MKTSPSSVRILAGYPDKNASLFKRIGVPLGDPAAWIEIDSRRIALVRDLEMDRVVQMSHADDVTCPAEHAPPFGLSADRETATAQAVTQLLRSSKVEEVIADRSLPYIYAWHLQQAEISVRYDDTLGVIDRRQKTHQEIEGLVKAQHTTEEVMRILCERVAKCSVDSDGFLVHDHSELTCEWLRSMAAVEFMQRGFSMGHGAICATAPHVADCHHPGKGKIRTCVPVIIDLFPRDDSTRLWGDCTRTVVHGEPSDTVKAMHEAVLAAKSASTDKLRLGNTGDTVHKAAEDTLLKHGYAISRGAITEEPSIQHGTGHGIGLDVHEPILLDHGGGELLENEVFTIEPGLYGRAHGGVRVEDMLVVTACEPRNLNRLHDGLNWET
ncbi:M24 family metallopeptidase [Rhodopirellula sp.]|jgi:Xaa-Pro aminopeptidase|nr:M24 family metallopeptidase [Rhodopirellula sp.]MDA9778575.1 M24 family metallopeptidase [Rubripirellula sp.]